MSTSFEAELSSLGEPLNWKEKLAAELRLPLGRHRCGTNGPQTESRRNTHE